MTTGTGNTFHANLNSSMQDTGSRQQDVYDTKFPGLSEITWPTNQPGTRLKVCIATEDIVGPIRNGGIGTTYTHLSRLLAKAGHDVTIAYLRGSFCENQTMSYWIKWYNDIGVKFVPISPNSVSIDCKAGRWIRPMYALFEFLKSNKFDLVHASEWRGSAFVSLLAKKQGLAFADTTFVIKASSPWLWNRESGYHRLTKLDDLPKMHAERGSIELADMVIGGSRHLLRWMLDHGYCLPEGRTYVQPNVMIPLDLDDIARARREQYGKRITIDEIVFFGRLEQRKGLDIFFDSLEIILNQGIPLPKITLMGKYGSKIPNYSELTIPEYIQRKSTELSLKFKILSNYGNEEALRYLLGGNRLAIMPSRIENSSLCVYETVYYAIPFIASDSGGTPELIHKNHRNKVLTKAHPVPLAEKIGEAISSGGFVAQPSFDNDKNLAIWLGFHEKIGGALEKSRPDTASGSKPIKVSICFTNTESIEYNKLFLDFATKEMAKADTEIILIDSSFDENHTPIIGGRLGNHIQPTCKMLECSGYGEQYDHNLAAQKASGDLLVFLEQGVLLKLEAVSVLRRAAQCSDADLFGCNYEKLAKANQINRQDGVICCDFIDDHTSSFFSDNFHSPMLAVRKEVFAKMGGFQDDHQVPGALSEFVNLAKLRNYKVETIPQALVWRVDEFIQRKRLNYEAEPFRRMRPYWESAPECFRRILMMDTTAAGSQAWQTSQEATETIVEAETFPNIISFSAKLYHLQTAAFKRLINFEIKVLKAVVYIKRRLI